MAGDCKVKRKGEAKRQAEFLQVVIDAVPKAVILLPLFARAFSRNEREEEGRVFPFITVGYFLHWMLPRHGDFLAGEVLAVGEPAVHNVFFGQAEDVVTLHALSINSEQEDVAGEDDLPWLAAQVKAVQAFHFVKRKAVPLYLDVVAHVKTLKKDCSRRQAHHYSKFIDPLQIPDIEGNGVTSQLLILQPRVVVAHQQNVEVLERNLILAQVGNEPPEIHFQLIGRIIPPLVPQFLNARVYVG